MRPEVAGVIFFKISSTAVRIAIMEKLIHDRHGPRYNLFWNAFLKQLRQIDTKRNEIVHWKRKHQCPPQRPQYTGSGGFANAPEFLGQNANQTKNPLKGSDRICQ